MIHKLKIVFALSLLLAMTVPHGLFAQSFTAGCYTRNPDGTPNTLIGQPVDGKCQDSNGSPTYPYGSNGQPGTAGSGNLQYVPLEPLSITQNSQYPTFCDTVNRLFKILIYVGGMLAVLYLVIGGITFMVSEVVNKRIVARQRIQGALWGLAILLTSWVVLNTLNPATIRACNMLAPYQSNGIIGNGQTGPQTVGINNDTLSTSDGNAAITRQQNAGSGGQTLESLQAANANLRQLEDFCTGALGGTIANQGYSETPSGCAADDPAVPHYYGNRSYAFCKKIPVPSSSSAFKLCFYNGAR